ncbi:hypothetical protein QBZ16_005014 [Prototheca wickerhamii]|uniref:Uncharacterized protein n=1 Tax=Prototheca wickerhamii TaxID=3111 RepID=A0AAD9MKQ4_PROWI|nr:hypothetical protein QBZ16_005014 [Prototheca wickerhamii]
MVASLPIGCLVLEPLPVGAWAFLGVTVAVATKTLTFAQAFTAFTNDVIWLIVVSFFFAKAREWGAGKSTLGLAYGLSAAETVIAPAMPSTTARAGGIFMPIISSLAQQSGSKPNDPSRKKLGAFLVLSQLQSSASSSALFLTAAAQNLLCIKLAGELGAAVAPAAVVLLLTPALMYKLFPPEIRDTPEAPKLAEAQLRAMGPMSRDERLMLATMAGAVVLWVAGDALGISAVVTAMLGLCALLLTGVLTWRDCITHPGAWDTLFWFAILVGMSGQLNAMGIISHFAGLVGDRLVAANLGWPAVFGLLNAVYFVLHYMFASQTAHVGALYSAFLGMMLVAGVPGPLAALSLGYMSNLFGSVTHFGSGQAAVYYGAGYLELKEVFLYGALMAVVNLGAWGGVGAVWWKLLGLF